MRALIASRVYAPEPAAAAYRLAALVRVLAGRGVEVEVLTSRPPRRFPIDDPPDVRVRRAPVLRDRSGAVRGYLQYASFDLPLAARLLVARRPDVVVVEPPPTTGAVVRAVCALRRIPYLYYAGDVLEDAARSAGSPAAVLLVVRLLERASWRGASRVLSVSSDVTRRLLELGVRRRSIVEVGNGVDTDVFAMDGPTRSEAGPYVLYAGTASEVHGAAVFIEALAMVDDLRLVLVGSGAEWESLRRLADRLAPGRVDFHGTVPPEEVARWLRGADAALASVRPDGGYGFAFPTKMYAAVAAGVPVLYAGGGPGRDFASSAPHSFAVDYAADAVAGALRELQDRPRTAAHRAEIARWGRASVSIEAAAGRAADAVMSSAERTTA